MHDLVKLYNPANSATLTPEQVSGLQSLTSAEIKELAIAYPNMTMRRAYLLIVNSKLPVEKQLPSLCTFENLWNLREKNGLRNYVAFQFTGNYKAVQAPAKARRTEVKDLSDVELMSLPGFKTKDINHAAQNVEVKKINFEAIPLTSKPKGRPKKTEII